MERPEVFSVDDVLLSRRSHYIKGTLLLSKHHLVFSFSNPDKYDRTKEIWICYPIIERISKNRGSSWAAPKISPYGSIENTFKAPTSMEMFDKYTASNIRIFCKDFTYYSLDFLNDQICMEVFVRLSQLTTAPKVLGSKKHFYAFDYKPNKMESQLEIKGWHIYSPSEEYKRLNLIGDNASGMWRQTTINQSYKFCPSYPQSVIVPSCISDSVLQHAGKFRSKHRIPVIVYRHWHGQNNNLIARCAQPLVGLNLQNRSIQDERLIEEIFVSQELDKKSRHNDGEQHQPQKNLIVDLRPVTNAMAQHALGAGTENVDNYRGKEERKTSHRQVDKIFCNIDNIHVMRESLEKLTTVLDDLDRLPLSERGEKIILLLQALTKTQWLHRILIILQAVDRITKSVHLNNTNVVIHCSDGWDRTSQVSALLQLCLDPYFRTIKGFMVLVEKEWVSFGFKFATRADHGGCIGAQIPNHQDTKGDVPSESPQNDKTLKSNVERLPETNSFNTGGVSSFLQKAASHIKRTASAAAFTATNVSEQKGDSSFKSYRGSSEKSPVFHQFLDCVYQILRQNPECFEFGSRFLKRLFYHYHSCQYGTFLSNSEQEIESDPLIKESTLSVWDYFLSRTQEFSNKNFNPEHENQVIFFNYSDVKWWSELYGRPDEEMNQLSNSLDRKFADLGLKTRGLHKTIS